MNGKTHLQNLDADILEDMAAYGLEYPRSKVKWLFFMKLSTINKIFNIS